MYLILKTNISLTTKLFIKQTALLKFNSVLGNYLQHALSRSVLF